MKGPGKRYVRTIFTRDGNFVLKENHGYMPEEVINVEQDQNSVVVGWYVTVCGYGEVPKEEGINE